MSFRPAALVAFLLRAYRALLSPLLGPACRYHPSCSHYAEDAVLTHGLASGTAMALGRLLRCHPWAEGGFDPVPSSRRGESRIASRS